MVVETGLVFELASEAEGVAESEPVKTADIGSGSGSGCRSGTEADVVLDPRSAAEFGLVVSGSEMCHSLLSGAEVVTESKAEFGFVAASGPDYMTAPSEDTQGDFAVVGVGVQLGAIAVEPDLVDKPETEELDPFAGAEELDASAVAPVWVSTAVGTRTDPEGIPGGKVELVQHRAG